MQNTTIAVDIAKSVFEIAVSTRPGTVAERIRLSRPRFLEFFAQREASVVLLEACGSAHYWARRLQELGHQVRLLPPHEVSPYVTRNKTDRNDAKALLEASRNQEIRPVPVKSVPQHTLMALHRLRSAWLAARTARLNTVRGLLRELGFVIPVGARQVVPRVQELVEDPESGLPDALRGPFSEALDEIVRLEARIRDVERRLEHLARQLPVVGRLRTVPGIGLLTATALVAFVGDVTRFPSGRHFASYLGLTPSERSSALRRRLGAISKRGNTYLRMLLSHGARAVLIRANNDEHDRLRSWARQIQQHRGHNKATIALANKLARIAWAVWKKEGTYRAHDVAA
jgi:transposase